MKRLLGFVLALAFVVPAKANERVTALQLEQIIVAFRARSDEDIARRLSALQLTERISPRRLASLESVTAGDKARYALTVLADEAAFLSLPASEIPSIASPALPEQRRIMGLVVAYVSKTIPQLPNFLATRKITRFQDTPMRPGPEDTHFIPLRPVGNSSATVLYRDGREAEENGSSNGRKPPERNQGLTTWGEFGPILSTILVDAAQNRLSWSHWEQGESSALAFFAYSVPKEKSHYEVDYCCVADSTGTREAVFHELAGYHGEIGVDSNTGAIRRLTIEADLKPGEPISRAAVVVEYAPVQIGGREYICPVHAVALSRAQSAIEAKDILVPSAPHTGAGTGGVSVVHTTSLTPGPEQTLLNDTVFTQYHVFRSESRFVMGTAAEQSRPGAPANESGEINTASVSGVNMPLSRPAATPEVPRTQYPSSLLRPESTEVDSTLNTIAPAVSPPDLLESDVTPSVVSEVSSQPQSRRSISEFTIRTVSRIVDITVVAFDKVNHPVTDLRPADFEILDNGRKQDIRYFNQGAQTVREASFVESEFPGSNGFNGFIATNRPRVESRPAALAGATILLLDASKLAFSDLTHARDEMLRFLGNMPKDERVGLYARGSHGFEVLLEPTTQHDQVVTRLRTWMPNAQDLARSQEEEQRNRRQFDWVHSIYDLAYVNGNGEGGNDPEMYMAMKGPGDQAFLRALSAPPDAKLRTVTGNPQREALLFLEALSRHLATLPGHKILVWISSDNVLADWSSQAAAKEDHGSNFPDALVLHTAEALNEAHVSLYPLDASQLEAGGITADIGTRNVLAIGKSDRDQSTMTTMNPGRATAQMQQDTHPIQPIFRELAEASGGRSLRRAGDIAAELGSILTDGRAAYFLSFTPDIPPDDLYHHLTVRLTSKRDITLRYRTGYLYEKEPSPLIERFERAVWQPADLGEIALSAILDKDTNSTPVLKVNVAATDLALAQEDGQWTDKLDIWLVDRDDAALHANLSGQTLALHLRPATYQRALTDGISFYEPFRAPVANSVLRIVVADENSGRIGTVTWPFSSPNANK